MDKMRAEETVEVIQLVPQERIQERIAEQVVDIPLPQIMEEILFSSTYASESYGRTDRGRLLSSDSGGNFRVGVIRHAFHLAQILRAHATHSQVSSSALLGSSSSSHPQACRHAASNAPDLNWSPQETLLRTAACSGHPFPSVKVGFTARTQGACSQRRCGESPVRSCRECYQNTSLWKGSGAECRDSVCVEVLRNNTVML